MDNGGVFYSGLCDFFSRNPRKKKRINNDRNNRKKKTLIEKAALDCWQLRARADKQKLGD